MEKNKYLIYVLKILLGAIILAGIIVMRAEIPLPFWVQLLLIIIIEIIWLYPRGGLDRKIRRAERCRDRSKAIGLFKEILSEKKLPYLEKIYVLEQIAKLYSELEEDSSSTNYYRQVIDILKNQLKNDSLSEIDKAETLGRLSINYFQIDDYQTAANYFEEANKICVTNQDCYLDSRILLSMTKIYLANQQKQKAREWYKTFRKIKKCKKNREVEQLLY